MDPITVGAVILTCAITIFVMIYFWGVFGDTMKIAVSNSPGNESVAGAIDDLTVIYSYLDYGIPMLVGGLMIVSLVLAFKTGAGIIYAFLSLIAWAFALLMSAVYTMCLKCLAFNFSNSGCVVFPILVFIMANMKWIVLAWIFLISLIMFTRTKKEDAQFNQGMQQLYG